jgi:lipid II:glycine glycyltransferase (peptidoglycan interpeptide bridge formation enzyme)
MDVPVSYCLAWNGNVLEGYAMIYEYKKILAEIKSGPLATSPNTSMEIILEAISKYKKRGFLSLQVLLGMEAGSAATFLQYSVYRKQRFKWSFDKFNKGTLLLKLDDKSDEQLLKHFSENHRRAIKKGKKYNLICRKLSTTTEIFQFADGYSKMFMRRRIKRSYDKSLKSFISIFEWLKNKNVGFFVGTYEEEKMVGGMLILIRNDRAEYYSGFTLPDERKLPIAHLAFYETMKLLKQSGIAYFDFGGFNALVDENDQIYQINKFKKGFNGDYFFYPPRMYFGLKPLGNKIIRILKAIKESYTKK